MVYREDKADVSLLMALRKRLTTQAAHDSDVTAGAGGC